MSKAHSSGCEDGDGEALWPPSPLTCAFVRAVLVDIAYGDGGRVTLARLSHVFQQTTGLAWETDVRPPLGFQSLREFVQLDPAFAYVPGTEAAADDASDDVGSSSAADTNDLEATPGEDGGTPMTPDRAAAVYLTAFDAEAYAAGTDWSCWSAGIDSDSDSDDDGTANGEADYPSTVSSSDGSSDPGEAGDAASTATAGAASYGPAAVIFARHERTWVGGHQVAVEWGNRAAAHSRREGLMFRVVGSSLVGCVRRGTVTYFGRSAKSLWWFLRSQRQRAAARATRFGSPVSYAYVALCEETVSSVHAKVLVRSPRGSRRGGSFRSLFSVPPSHILLATPFFLVFFAASMTRSSAGLWSRTCTPSTEPP